MFRLSLLSIFVLILSCNTGKNKPDVSNIKVDMQLERFDKDLFMQDTNHLSASMPQLQQKYPGFLPIYLQYVLGLDNHTPPDTVLAQVKYFISQDRFLYDSVQKKYPDLDAVKSDMATAFQYVKYYYPQYSVPKLITLVGPIDALAKLNESYTPDFLGKDFLGISLQFYLGKNFSVYQDQNYILNVAPQYRSRRFDKEYIVPDAMQLITDDIYPDKSGGRPLMEQMIEKGKQWYMLTHFLPDAPDSVITGYTQKQLDWSRENEGNIWGYFLKNENLYTIEPTIIQTYIGEAPFTQGMPESSPGNIGQWIGWRIIEKFAADHNKLTMQQVLQTPAKTIFSEAKYKPK
jgi:hypothetical protein